MKRIFANPAGALVAILLILLAVTVLMPEPAQAGTSSKGYLLSGATNNGIGLTNRVSGVDVFTVVIEGTNITTGADVQVHALSEFGNWIPVHVAALNSSTNAQVVQWIGPFKQIRAFVTNYTDGTYFVTLFTIRND